MEKGINECCFRENFRLYVARDLASERRVVLHHKMLEKNMAVTQTSKVNIYAWRKLLPLAN